MARIWVLTFAALSIMGCGGRSKLVGPVDDKTKSISPGIDASIDVSWDVLANPTLRDARPVQSDVIQNDTIQFFPDGPQVPDGPALPSDVKPEPDSILIPPLDPDGGPDLLPPPRDDVRPDVLLSPNDDARPDWVSPTDNRMDSLLPPPMDVRPDWLVAPPPFDLRPDQPPPSDVKHDGQPLNPDLVSFETHSISPDALLPFQLCVNGEACSSDCTASCQFIGTSACTCNNGTLSCGTCQLPHIVITITPCPDNLSSGVACDNIGLACPVYANGGIAGGCVCLNLGDGPRYFCL
jgi:hypothetical protein